MRLRGFLCERVGRCENGEGCIMNGLSDADICLLGFQLDRSYFDKHEQSCPVDIRPSYSRCSGANPFSVRLADRLNAFEYY